MKEVNPSESCYPLISFPKKRYITNQEQIYPRKRFRLSKTCHDEVFKKLFDFKLRCKNRDLFS